MQVSGLQVQVDKLAADKAESSALAAYTTQVARLAGHPSGGRREGGTFPGEGGGAPLRGKEGGSLWLDFWRRLHLPPSPALGAPPTHDYPVQLVSLFQRWSPSSLGPDTPPPPPQVADLFQQLATSAADSSAAALAPVRQQLAGQGEQLAQLAAGARAEAAATAGEGGQLPGSCRGEREGEAVPRLSTRNLT